MARGDLLVLYTDGMWEAADRAGVPFGIARMQTAIAGAAARGAEAVRDALTAGTMATLDGQAPLDDMTVVVVERR